MPGRARFITGGKMLKGLKVNVLQRNATSGLGMRADVAPPSHKKKKKGKKKIRLATKVTARKKLKARPLSKPSKSQPCPTCGKLFRTASGRNAHASSIHGIDSSSVASVVTTVSSTERPAVQVQGVGTPASELQSELQGNVNSPPSKKVKIVCPICGEGLGKYQLLKHYRSAHAGFWAKG